jgi:hypothetical protein
VKHTKHVALKLLLEQELDIWCLFMHYIRGKHHEPMTVKEGDSKIW